MGINRKPNAISHQSSIVTTVYIPIFYRDTAIYWSKIYGFSPFLRTAISFEAVARGVPGTYGTKVGLKIAHGLRDDENRMILRSLVLTH